jgi:hypothetical protein
MIHGQDVSNGCGLRLCHYLDDEKGLRGGMAAEIYGAMRPKRIMGPIIGDAESCRVTAVNCLQLHQSLPLLTLRAGCIKPRGTVRDCTL